MVLIENPRRIFIHFLVLINILLLEARVDFLPDWVFARGIQLSSDSKPFDLIFHLEKIVCGAVIFWGVLKLFGIKVKRIAAGTFLKAVGICLLGAVAALILPALLIHYVKVDIKWPSIMLPWMIINLFFVSIPEELVYRNYLQEGFTQSSNKFFSKYSLLLVSLLFGLHHFRTGISFMFLCVIAGLFYGYAYKRAGLLGSITTHFLVNFLHFVFFSYPALLKLISVDLN